MFIGYSKGFYKDIHEQALASAREIVPFILKLTKAGSVVDAGCGQGAWLSVFRDNSVLRTLGIDGAHVPNNSLLIPRDSFRAVDLNKPPADLGKFDLALSLEVGEHLPSVSADAYVAFLVSLAPVILFSAAVPLQDGTRHVNEQWQSYWAEKFKGHGFVVVDAIRPEFWSNENVAPWYRQNILMYVKKDKLSDYPLLQEAVRHTNERMLSMVHPQTYLRSNVRPVGSFWKLVLWFPRLAVLKLLRLLE